MAIYYVDFTNGSDSNNGLGPDASHATNKPWKTIAKLLGASGMASGDTAYLAPGVYRERVTVGMTSATVETSIFGDPSNAQGFKTSSGVRVAPGPVVHTCFETSDTAVPSATAAALNLAGRDYLTFDGIIFVGGGNYGIGTAHCIDGGTATSTNITLRNCAFFGSTHSGTNLSSALVRAANAGTTAYNWLIERCVFMVGSAGIGVQLAPTTSTTGADYDTLFTVRNSIFLGNYSRGVMHNPGGTNTFKPGGTLVECCTFVGAGSTATIQALANTSTSIPVIARNNYMQGAIGLVAAAAGPPYQMTSAANIICCTTRYTNVAAGTGDSADGAMAAPMWLGQEMTWNWPLRQPFTPIYGASGAVGFVAGSSPPATDFTNRTRPEGGQSTNITPGALELHNTAAQETTVVDASGSGLDIVGPGSHELVIPVDATSTTLTIRVRYDANHGTTNKPQAILLASGQIGVETETKTATGSAGSWETLTFTAFTPTAAGAVRLRIVSRSAAGNGIAYFDTLTITASGKTTTVPFDHFMRDGSPVLDPVSSSGVIVLPTQSKIIGG